VVVVHDAARALVTPELVSEAIRALLDSQADAVVAAAPVTDTIKQADARRDGPAGTTLRVFATIDRSTLWAVQTPQVFRRTALERALEGPRERLAAATDDSWLVEQDGGTVTLLPASPENFKITTPLDLRLAGLLLAQRGAG
ncbi:MAG: IspD/TarI family cytidylyltransferase, partial [Solirubrobacteraceae bacterium]